MMTKENDLGPLWEGEPKTTGFRLVVPDPKSIYNWGYLSANRFADLPISEAENELIKEERSEDDQSIRSWSVDINDKLLESVGVTLCTEYSIRDGAIQILTAYVDFNKEMKVEQKSKLVRKYPAIENYLKRNRLLTINYKHKGERYLSVHKGGLRELVTVCLGYQSLDDVKRYKPNAPFPTDLVNQAFSIEINPAGMTRDGTNPERFLKDLSNFQYVLSHFVDAVYEVSGLFSPNIKLVLSELNEIP